MTESNFCPVGVFVHIPKTSGTSLANALVECGDICFDYGPDSPKTSAESKTRTLELFQLVPDRIYFGHFGYNYIDSEEFKVCRFSWVRNPIDRVVSAFLHERRHNNQDDNLENIYVEKALLDFIGRPRNQNTMSAFLGPDWAKFEFIGVTEHAQVSIELFSRKLLELGLTDTPIEGRRDNINPSKHGKNYEMSPEVLSFLINNNLRDMLIYRQIENDLYSH